MEISKDLLVSHFGCCLILGVSTCTVPSTAKPATLVLANKNGEAKIFAKQS